MERCASIGRLLRDGLESLRARHPGIVADVRGEGLLLGLQLDGARTGRGRPGGSAAERAGRLVAAARIAGEQLLPFTDGSGVLFAPPFTVTRRQIDRLLAVLHRSLSRLA